MNSPKEKSAPFHADLQDVKKNWTFCREIFIFQSDLVQITPGLCSFKALKFWPTTAVVGRLQS